MSELETEYELEEIPREWESLILEDQLLDHLATSAGAQRVYDEGLTSDFIAEREQDLRSLIDFNREWIDKHRTPPDVSVIEEELGLNAFNEPIAPIGYVIDRLRERYQRRHIRSITERASQLAGNPAEALNFMIESSQNLRKISSSKKGIVTSDDLLSVVDRYKARLEGGETGITYGFEDLDKHLGGLKQGELTVLLARPKRYKSWLLLKSAAEAVRTQGTIAFATLELDEKEMSERFTCMMSNTSWSHFKGGTLREEDLIYMTEVGYDLQEHPYKAHFFRPMPGERSVSHLVAQAQEVGAKALYIDQLSWIDGARDERAWQKIGTIMEQLKDAAQHFPIFMAAQQNREAQGEEGIADIAKIGLSDFIGQTADNLLAIWASRDMMRSTPRIIHIGISESRSYEPVTWEILVELSKNSDFKCLGELDD